MPSFPAASLRGAVLLGAVFLGNGCSTVAYHAQSISGHISLMMKSRPIDDMVARPDTAATLKRKLHAVLEIREFASRELNLPDNASYRSYAELERPYVVWSVFATPAFSLEPKRWCFPVAGCVSYRGYFSESGAESSAEELGREGYDVYVAGVRAYSTLGWFADPVPSPVLEQPVYRTAQVIFHELAHQRLYVAGDTPFNEGFAVTVEREGMRRWLRAKGSEDMRAAYALSHERKEDFIALVQNVRARLMDLYRADTSDADKRREKVRIFEDMRTDYARLKHQWGDGGGYEAWFSQNINNAQLVAVTTYHDLVPAFERLLAEQNGSLPDFYAASEAVGRLPKNERRRALMVSHDATTAAVARERP